MKLFNITLKGNFYIFLALILLPIVYLIYIIIFRSDNFIDSFFNIIKNNDSFLISVGQSMLVSLITAFITTIISIYLILSIEQKSKILVYSIALMLFFVPADIQSVGIGLSFKYILGIQKSSLIIIIFALFLYCLPLNLLIISLANELINPTLMQVSNDLGASRWTFIYKIKLPLLFLPIVSSFLLSFIQSLNEYSRTFYLANSLDLLSTKLSGKLQSGANDSVYIICLLNLLLTGIIVSLIFKFMMDKVKNMAN